MRRRDFLSNTTALGIALAVSPLGEACTLAKHSAGSMTNATAANDKTSDNRLIPPAKGKIPVAFALSQYATVIDFAGPWEVFQDVYMPTRGKEMDEQMP